MVRVRAVFLLALLVVPWGCSRENQEAPAPDVAAEAPAAQEGPPGEKVPKTLAEATKVGGEISKRTVREPYYKHLAQIRNDGDASAGRVGRMFLKLNRHYEYKPRWIVMLATDGSYGSTMLHYDESFDPIVNEMKPGFVYDVEFEVLRVTSGGQPWGEVLSVDQKSSAPVADQTGFMPAVEAINKAKELPEQAKEARRQMLHDTLSHYVDEVDRRTEAIKAGDAAKAEGEADASEAPPAPATSSESQAAP